MSAGAAEEGSGYRTEFARRFIEPNYTAVDLPVVKLRNFFAEFGRVAQEYGERTIKEAGGDPSRPVNAHHAATHHTAFLSALDHAKDEYIKWLLASTAKMDDAECVVADDLAAELFAASAKRKRE